MKKVTCTTVGCVNEGVEVGYEHWDGSQIVCGPCGVLLVEQAEWYEPPTLESLGIKSGPERAADLIAAMSEQERVELAQLIAPAPALEQARKP